MKSIKKGIDLRIDATARILHPQLIDFGTHVSIDVGVYISTKGKIGDYVHIAPYACIIGGIDAIFIMEDFTGISAGAKVICAGDDFTKGHLCPFIPLEFRYVINKPIIFRRFSCIGVNSIVMPGITLAEGSVLGAGSVLTKDTLPWMIYVGSPARPVKKRDSELVIEGFKKLGYEL